MFLCYLGIVFEISQTMSVGTYFYGILLIKRKLFHYTAGSSDIGLFTAKIIGITIY